MLVKSAWNVEYKVFNFCLSHTRLLVCKISQNQYICIWNCQIYGFIWVRQGFLNLIQIFTKPKFIYFCQTRLFKTFIWNKCIFLDYSAEKSSLKSIFLSYQETRPWKKFYSELTGFEYEKIFWQAFPRATQNLSLN